MGPWLQVASPLLVGLLAAGGALLGVRLTGRANDRATEQREAQGRREEWSKRFYEVLAYVIDESPRKRETGLCLMAALAESDLAGPDELRLMEALADRVLNPMLRELYGPQHPGPKDQRSEGGSDQPDE